MNLSAELARLAIHSDTPVDLAHLALHLATDEYPTLDIPVYLARIDALAATVAPRLLGSLDARTLTFCHFLFVEQRFAGNDAGYYDPRNSYLNDVLDRKVGIPISLTLLAIAVGERAGFPVVGVGLPGHFIAKVTDGSDEILFDPYHGGRRLGRGGCEAFAKAVTGQPFEATDAALAACPPGLIVQRMLNNLKANYLRAGDFARAARVIERLVVLAPTDPTQRRDLGVSYFKADQPGKAIDPLTTYLTTVPMAADADVVADFLKSAKRELAQWN